MKFLNVLGVAALLSVAAADDKSILYKEIARATNESLLWGAYRPNLYFGVRPRLPKSLMAGLMWAKLEDYQGVQTSKWSRHLATFDELGYLDLFADAN
jgi:mannosyl-oligosaccharide glucosidase